MRRTGRRKWPMGGMAAAEPLRAGGAVLKKRSPPVRGRCSSRASAGASFAIGGAGKPRKRPLLTAPRPRFTPFEAHFAAWKAEIASLASLDVYRSSVTLIFRDHSNVRPRARDQVMTGTGKIRSQNKRSDRPPGGAPKKPPPLGLALSRRLGICDLVGGSGSQEDEENRLRRLRDRQYHPFFAYLVGGRCRSSWEL